MRILPTAPAEAVEAESMYLYEAGAPLPDQEILGVATYRFDGGVVLSARNDASGFWSKALGFGFGAPVTGDLIDRILDVYRAEANPHAGLEFAPEVLPRDWDDIVATRGLRPGPLIVKLAARVDEITPGPSDLRIAPVADDEVAAWAAAVLTGLGRPLEGFGGMFAATARLPQFHPYAAWAGDDLVGGANLYVDGAVASLNAGAVLPASRRHGGQTGLIAARAARARELGCEWIVTECAQPTAGTSNPSLNNMLRAGFRPLYQRQHFYVPRETAR
ncbi:hypothetical protein [Catenuloplanes japonicus]|uniref:hypothetical protein n=1 Tax=Catenuloplanes japonicus TaxID=33876 RepID=UPI000692166D|nr:hypothetical protein [Catenuloplanes japonicus]